jgi:hypothetical protein
VSALKRLSASSSGRSIHKALNQFVATQVRIAEVSGAPETMQFHGVQHLQTIMTDPGSGKPVTTFVGAGSTIDAHLDLKIHGEEFNRLASLDYTKFDDTRANEIMADKNAENKLPEAEKSFAQEFRFADMSTSMRVGLKATIN